METLAQFMTTPPPHSPPTALDALTVIIVTFNSVHCLPALAQSLKAFSHVLVVDNASSDGLAQALPTLLPQARLIQNPRNLGFGAANNKGLALVETPYSLLLNPDCELTAQKALDLLAVAQQFSQAAIVAPQLLDDQGKAHINYRWPASYWPDRGPGADGPCSVGFACGAALLLNMEVMRPIGFFDEDFFLYYEDDDLCQRVFEARRSIVIAPHVRLTHASRGSVRGDKPWRSEFGRGYHHAQSKILYTAKHRGYPQAKRLRRRVLALAVLGLLLRSLIPVPKHLARLWGRVRGLWQMQVPQYEAKKRKPPLGAA